MKSILFILCFSVSVLNGQHTFSIVAADPITKEIGSAGATCLDNVILNGEEGALVISDIIPGKGAINTQAWWTPVNMNAALTRMEIGDSPEEIVEWLKQNDNPSQGGSINDRQYGIVDIENNSVRSAAFTGSNNFSIAGHLTGENYAIQGNILISQEVLEDMEKAFLESNGTLADKIMAAMQGAKRPGADQRCLNEGVSSLSAFLRVAKPTDTDASYGNLSIDINIGATPFGIEPIDELQDKYDEYKSTVSTSNLTSEIGNLKIFPNPNNIGEVTIQTELNINSVKIYKLTGEFIDHIPVSSNGNINISRLEEGLYLLYFFNENIIPASIVKLIIH